MKYYLIAGEASGDLHASHLIAALKAEDPQAEFRGFGGNLMEAEGMTLVRHYRDLAYMGFIPVLLHARAILQGMAQCKRDIEAWQPDVLILVDYPGFNLKMAKFAHSIGCCPVFYYIAPKLWAWKEYRIKALKRDVDELFSILPFEVDFFERKHHYPIHYVGNPTMDEVSAYLTAHTDAEPGPTGTDRPVIALLPGSRQQEIRDNLSRMLRAVEPYRHKYQIAIAAAPGIDPSFYEPFIGPAAHFAPAASASSSAATVPGASASGSPIVLCPDAYALLHHATAALVTSGTATLEAALFRVPQVVCYYMKAGRLASWGKRLLLKVPYVSLVNLIAGREVVPELVADQMNVANLQRHLAYILPGGHGREAMLQGYDEVASRLGEPGAPQHAARLMLSALSRAK